MLRIQLVHIILSEGSDDAMVEEFRNSALPAVLVDLLSKNSINEISKSLVVYQYALKVVETVYPRGGFGDDHRDRVRESINLIAE